MPYQSSFTFYKIADNSLRNISDLDYVMESSDARNILLEIDNWWHVFTDTSPRYNLEYHWSKQHYGVIEIKMKLFENNIQYDKFLKEFSETISDDVIADIEPPYVITLEARPSLFYKKYSDVANSEIGLKFEYELINSDPPNSDEGLWIFEIFFANKSDAMLFKLCDY